MTTAADLIATTKDYLLAGHREPMNRLTTTVDSDDTSFTFDFELGAIQPGAYISIDLEILHVWEVTNASTKTISVQRAQRGSTATAHTAGAVVTVNPKFPDFRVLAAINDDLADLSSPANGLYQAKNVTLTYSPSVQGYDLTSVTDVLDILRVKYDEPGPAKRWPEINRWQLKRLSDTDDFASGTALVLNEEAHSGADVRVTYAAPFTPFTTVAQDAQSYAGLPATANDIPCLGAAMRLQFVREGQRNFNEAQSDTRRAGEVPVGAQINSAGGIARLRQTRIEAEAARLRRMFPARRKT